MGFTTWSAYRNFAHEVRTSNRYVLSEESKAFLEVVKLEAEEFKSTISNGAMLWRAQIGHDWREHEQDGIVMGEIPCPFPESRMFPEKHRAPEGRVNPKGIPCFYCASDRTTALSEVRPWLGATVSIGCFQSTKELTIVDCSEVPEHVPWHFNLDDNPEKNEPDQARIKELVWGWINLAFSRPVDPDDRIADYAPTQLIAEVWRQAGYDGIGYKSKLGSGYNIALFGLDSVRIRKCEIHEVKAVEYRHSESGNAWYSC